MTEDQPSELPSQPGEAETNGLGKRNVFYLGMVSLFTDLSSQMILFLVPLFLNLLGVSMAAIGVVEGVAESVATLLRTVFGRASDRLGKRKIFIYFGYGVSALTKPFFWFVTGWPLAFVLRFTERVGKAARTPARDALLSVSGKKKGRTFGFHRAMDRLGAVGGPLLALLVYRLVTGHAEIGETEASLRGLRMVFLASFIPAILALVFIPFAREVKRLVKKGEGHASTGLREKPFIMFLVAIIVFTLGNSSNGFLLLKAKEAGVTFTQIFLLWSFYNVFCAVSSPIFGHLSDVIGRTPVIVASFVVYAIVYLLFGFASLSWHVWALFAAYGLYYGLSNGVFRAYVADLVSEDARATAYGIMQTGLGLTLIPASILFGVIWDTWGSRYAFMVSAGFAMLGFLVFLVGRVMTRPIKAQ